jgi:hypothetical protein
MDVDSLDLIRLNIYGAKVNAVIPWAAVQTLTWVGGDPNPGTAFRVRAVGDFEVMPGYWFYKQVSRAGQPGMAVVPVMTTSGSGVELIGFAGHEAPHPDSLVVLNTARRDQSVRVRVMGSSSSSFRGHRTTRDLAEKYKDIGSLPVEDGWIHVEVPQRSAVTLFAE